jgi:hypothetical protein
MYECRATILEPKDGGFYPSMMKKELIVHIVGGKDKK